jgi:hypothetical protein
MLHNDVVKLTEKLDLIQTKQHVDYTVCRSYVREQVKFMFSVMGEHFEDGMAQLVLRLEYKKGDLKSRFSLTCMLVESVFLDTGI